MDAWLIKVKPSASSAGTAKKLKTPSRKKGKIPVAAAAKKKVINATKKKKAKNSTNLRCPVDLLAAHQSGTLHHLLNGLNTHEVRDYCQQCKVPRSGAKFKIISLLINHVEMVALVSSSVRAVGNVDDDGNGDSNGDGNDNGNGNHDHHSKYRDITLEFSSLSFARAHTKFCKLDALLKKQTKTKTASASSISQSSSVVEDAKSRWNTIVAAAKGFDFVIYKAITGPKQKQYNGSRGETGLEANDDVGRAVCSALINLCLASAQEYNKTSSLVPTTITEMDIEEGVEFITNNTKCEPYGFFNYNCNLKEASEDCKVQFERLSVEHKKKMEDVMATRPW
mmetsp:Transcript_10472/g.10114  ORF Transcript_10472/g.10114 Transcript_10472/m.10114 type:complete len:338 (-) Transcript_10472:54-1067(-)